jgi:hypothetical protein
MEKQIFNIDDVRRLLKEIKKYNDMDLSKCKFVENEKEIKIDKKIVD